MKFANDFANWFISLDPFFQNEQNANRVKETLTYRASLRFGIWLLLMPLWLPIRALIHGACYTYLYPTKVLIGSSWLVWKVAIAFSLFFVASRILWGLALLDAWHWVETISGSQGLAESLPNGFHRLANLLKSLSIWILGIWIIELSIKGYLSLKKQPHP